MKSAVPPPPPPGLVPADPIATPDAACVHIMSCDGYTFVVPREVAYQSPVIKGLVEAAPARRRGDGCWTDDYTYGKAPEVRLETITGRILDLVLQYLGERWASAGAISDFSPLQSLDGEREQDRDLVLDVLIAAEMLQC